MADTIRATYSYLPSGSGDGYGFGGGAVVTISGKIPMSVFFGEGNRAHTVAKHVADAINAFEKEIPDDDEIVF